MDHFFKSPNAFVAYNYFMYISASMVYNDAVDLKPTMDSNTATPYNAAVSLKIYSLLNGVMNPNIITTSRIIEDNNDVEPSNNYT